MPKKIRELLSALKKHGFIDRGGKGSHRNLVHKQGIRITISGNLRSDAKRYQERAVGEAIRRVRDEKKK
ncbi:MAG: addiction module toxin, HicA family [Opitutae bacterium]|nr:addiction module toxin, HicA family [Opitutae bacterium]MBC9890186.1 addiction module toxin, HicA family [Opitutae bacterium]